MRSPWTSNLFSRRRNLLEPGRARGGLARYLLLVLLPLVLGPLITVALLLYRQAQSDITQQVNAQLSSLANIKENYIDLWAADRAADMDNLARSPDILQATRAWVLEAEGSAAMHQAGVALTERFDRYLANPNNADYSALLLAHADTGAVVLASTSGQAMLGKMLLDEPYFRTARQGAILAAPRFDPRFDSRQVTIVAAAPVVDPEAGSIGVIVGVINSKRLADVVSSSTGLGLGRTGRAYAVTGDGYDLSSVINAQSAKPDSLGIQRARINHADGNDQYSDPNGQRVVGRYKWLPRYELALLVEQSVAEAYRPLASAGLIFAVIITLAVFVSTVGVLIFTRRLTRPIQDLTDSALRMAGGDLSAKVQIDRQDEIGLLAQAFNGMVSELRGLYQDLEAKVEARTRQLAAAAEVGRAASSILSVENLLTRTVELIRDRFGYYHVSIFLLDETGEYAILREATGEVGVQLKASAFHLLADSNSLIGWVMANKKPRVALDVGNDPFYFKHELLPDTRSEAAIPLRLGDRLLGVLDVQSRQVNAFTPADLETLQILADQIAVALENGRLFARQQRIVQLEQIVADFTAKIHRSPTFEAILENAATELGRALGARKAVVRLKAASGEAQLPVEAVQSGGNGQDSSEEEGTP